MNCAESQDLLLDLAYRELPPARAAEVEAHVLGCAACRAEMAQLDDARKAAAPLRELEEPPAGFDEPILRAARAEAGLQADGTPGPVVEISASVKPLGLQAARLDPHARMRGGTARPGPRWGRLAAVFGSIAAAAGLAVVVTSSLTTMHRVQRRAEEVAPIQVHAPGTSVPISLDDRLVPLGKAVAPEESSGARSREAGAPPPARAVDAAKQKVASAPGPAKEKAARSELQAPAASEEADRAVRVERRFKHLERPVEKPRAEGLALQSRGGSRTAAEASPEEPKPLAAEGVAGGTGQAPPAAAPPVAQVSRPAAHVTGAQPAALEPAPKSPDQLEDQASAARRRGDYARAAALYREASALRGQSEPARAAWDMAHAVECLAAGGQVDEAVAARRELLRAFPDHSGPKAAADSALRSVRLPADEEKPALIKE